MSESNCGGVERYKGLKPPTCLGGKGCDACWKKHKDSPSYSLPWLQRYRKAAFAKMVGHAKAKREPSVLRVRRKRLRALLEEVQVLSKEVVGGCPHLVENQVYEEYCPEDTLGNRSRGMCCTIRCEGCGNILERWSE